MSVLLLGMAALVFGAFVLMIVLMLSTPEVGRLGEQGFQQATIVYTAGGEELTRYYNRNRSWVELDAIAPVVVDALIATEDRRFYDHLGIDIRRTVAAVFQTLTGETQGGSTITMQVARNAFPNVSDDFILKRKAKEWLTALRLEREYSKDEILEIYLNTVPFNYNAYGVDAAAQTYFSKDAAALDTLQAATLVGMLKGTTIYNPVRNPEASRERRNVVLAQMAEAGYLTQGELQRLSEQETEIQFSPMTPTNNLAPYFADYVREWLDNWAAENGYNLYRDGLRVYTTLDAELQNEAEAAMHDQLEYLQSVVDVTWSQPNVPMVRGSAAAFQNYRERVDPFSYFWESNPQIVPELIRSSTRYQALTDGGTSESQALERLQADQAFVDSLKSIYSTLQAGLVAMNPDNGHLKAWVGGRDYGRYQFDHVSDAKRQPGSTFKPFVYATALRQGISPRDSLRDRQIEYVAPRTNRVWSPGNFGDETGEMISVRDGLALSKNTITAQLILEVGPDEVAETAHRMGIESELNEVPSLALGTSEVSLLEMVAAYGTIAELGTYHQPVAVTHIENADGRRLATFRTETRQALEPELAYTLLDMMRGVVDYGTGIRIRSQYGAEADLAAKTGTTQRGADGWFILLHPNMVIGSWVGFPSPAVSFRTRYWGQGSHNALRLVGDLYTSANLSPSAEFRAPEGYVPPQERRLRAADTSAFEMPDVARGDDRGFARTDTMRADTAFARGEDRFTDLDDERLAEEVGDEEGFNQEGDEPFAQNDAFDDDGEFFEPQGDEAEDYGGAADEVQQSTSEADRLNRQERRNSEVDEYLQQLEERDN